MLGLKINYSKSSLIYIDLDYKKGDLLASILGCKRSPFPLTYLGLPLKDTCFHKSD